MLLIFVRSAARTTAIRRSILSSISNLLASSAIAFYEVAEAAGPHLRLGDLEQFDDARRPEAVARIDQPAAVLDHLPPGGPLRARDHGAHAGRGLAVVPRAGGDLVRQCKDLPSDHRRRDEVADGGAREQHPDI